MLNQKDEIKMIIQDTIVQISRRKNGILNDVKIGDTLNSDLGFSSLDLAQLVAILELKLDADPFTKLVPITSIRTVGDLYNAYLKFFNEDEEVSTIINFDGIDERATKRISSSLISQKIIRQESQTSEFKDVENYE